MPQRKTVRVERKRLAQLERIALTRLIINYNGHNIFNLDFENAYLVAMYSESTMSEVYLKFETTKVHIIPPLKPGDET